MIVYILVLVLYLALLGFIGYLFRGSSKSAEDFAIGGRTVGPWVSALSFVAAYYSSVVIIGGGAFGWRFGLSTLWIGAMNVFLGTTLAWVVLGKRVRRFTERLNVSTLSGFFAERYASPSARMFSATVTSIFLVVYNVSVLKGMANAFEVLMDMPYWGGVLLSAGVILFYTAVGGYLAVVWTSFAQAIVMLAALVLLAAVTVARVGGLASLADRLHALDPGLVSSPGVWGWSGLLSFSFIVSLGTWGMPQLIIRFYSIRNTRMLRVGIVVVTLGAAMALSPYLCGAAARILVPSVANPDLAIPALTDLVLNDWGGALFLAGVIAAGMSTFAGVLIIISSSLVRDVWIEGLGRSLSPSSEVRTNRILSLGVGVASLLIALRPPALILVLTAFAWAVIASTNLWPLLFGLYCRRTSPRAAVASMAAGASVAFLWQILIKRLPASWRGIHGFVVGLAIGLLVIGLGTLFGRPAPREAVRRAWGEEA